MKFLVQTLTNLRQIKTHKTCCINSSFLLLRQVTIGRKVRDVDGERFLSHPVFCYCRLEPPFQAETLFSVYKLSDISDLCKNYLCILAMEKIYSYR